MQHVIKNVLVSVCIPTYEREGMLEQAIESILNQTYKHFEIIVSDNASTSYNIFERLARYNDNRMKVFRNDNNIGMVSNFNACISRSSGQLIKPLCDDDALHPECLQSLVDRLQGTDFCIIRDKHWTNHKSIEWNDYTSIESKIIEPGLTRDILKVDCVSPTNVAFTRNIWDEIGPYDENILYSFDYHFSVKARCRYRTLFIKTPLCIFRQWENSATSKNRNPFKNYSESVSLMAFLWTNYPHQRNVTTYKARIDLINGLINFVKKSLNLDFSHNLDFITTASKSLEYIVGL